MKTRTTNLLSLRAPVLVATLLLFGIVASAQSGNSTGRANPRVLYHDGPVMLGTVNVYFIWYGNWSGNVPGSPPETRSILIDLAVNLGGSDYHTINTGYPDSTGSRPSGSLIFGGSVDDAYSRGSTLTTVDIQGVISDLLSNHHLPLDPNGIYIVLGSSDVTDIHSDSTTFCTPFKAPHRGFFTWNHTPVKYAFVGNAARCPTSAAPQFVAPDGSLLPTPNGHLAGDAMASTMAAVLSASITNPLGTGWFDIYGLENSTKCQGKFGLTYLAANGGRANMRFGQRDFLIQQNWVNNPSRGYCSLSSQ